MIVELSRLLDFLSESADTERALTSENRFRQALDYDPVDRLPLVISGPLPPEARFRPFPHREVFTNPEKMLYNELVHAFETSIAHSDRVQDDLPWTVRANFGTVLISSLFGAPVEQLEDNPPWIRHEAGSEIVLDAVLDRDPLDFSQGCCPRVVETMQAYHAILRKWPELYPQIHIVLPDLQGPLDNLELIRGSELLLELATEPDKVHEAMDLVATAQIEFARNLLPLATDGPPGYCHQHAVMQKGNILLRCDTAVMISAEMYRRQVAPHDERVLRELGGGGIHCCGCFQHLAPEFLRLPSLKCIDLGQPELNDVDGMYEQARVRKVPLIRVLASEEDLQTGAIQQRFPTGVTLVQRMEDRQR